VTCAKLEFTHRSAEFKSDDAWQTERELPDVFTKDGWRGELLTNGLKKGS